MVDAIVVNLTYDANRNVIVHEDGRVLDDISHLLPYKELEFLKRVGGTIYIDSDEDGVVYELTAPIPGDEDGVMRFYYDREQNVMVDDGGYINFNIHSYVSPSVMTLFKKLKTDMRVYGKNGCLIELIYSQGE